MDTEKPMRDKVPRIGAFSRSSEEKQPVFSRRSTFFCALREAEPAELSVTGFLCCTMVLL